MFLFYSGSPIKWSAKGLTNVFALTRVRYIRVLFHTFYYYWAEEYGFLCWGPFYVGVCYIGFHWTQGAFHYAKISGNFSLNINGTLRSRWKFSGKSGPPPELVLFDRLPTETCRSIFKNSPFQSDFTREQSKVQCKWNASVWLEILFLSSNVVPFSLG